jgi:hypothetical protein
MWLFSNIFNVKKRHKFRNLRIYNFVFKLYGILFIIYGHDLKLGLNISLVAKVWKLYFFFPKVWKVTKLVPMVLKSDQISRYGFNS